MAMTNFYTFEVTYRAFKHRTEDSKSALSAYGDTEEEARGRLDFTRLVNSNALPDAIKSVDLLEVEEVPAPDFSSWGKGREAYQPYTANWWAMQE